MATQPLTIACPKCGERTSITEDHCEHCGCYIRNAKSKKPLHHKWWFWAIIVIVAIWILPFGSSDDSDTEADDKATNISEPADKSDNAGKDNPNRSPNYSSSTNHNKVTNDSSSTNTNSTPKPESSSTAKPSNAPSEEDTSTETTIQQQVLLDQDGIKITATEYIVDTLWGDGIKVLIENNTDQNIRVGCNTLIVNNYMINDWFTTTVAAGKKVYDTIDLSSTGLKEAGIKNVGQVEVGFNVYNSDTYDDILDTDVITIKTSEFDNMDTTPNDAGFELCNTNGVRIVGKYVDEDSFWGSSVLLYIENNTDKIIRVTSEYMSINDFMVDGYLWNNIYPGKMAIDDITVFSSDLEENGITTIEQIELSFHVIDTDSYDTIFETEPIAFSVNK